MERPSPIRSPRLADLLGLAGELLDAEPVRETHAALLTASFHKPLPQASLDTFAARTLEWFSHRPLPRLRTVQEKLRGDSLFRELCATAGYLPRPLRRSPRMLTLAGLPTLPPLTTLGDLAAWLRLDPGLQAWMADLQDRNASAPRTALQHYTVHLLPKVHGGIRVVEAPKPLLRSVQRQILREILTPVPLHPAVHGFRKGHSIVSFATPHAGKAVVLRLDLQDFFPSISGPRVQALFRTLGYPERVADVLGGLCTVTTPRALWKRCGPELLRAAECAERARFYARPHLPQGAPTSPALANLCAFRLDRRLAGLAVAAGATYTRYADDLAFSGAAAFDRRGPGFAAHVAAIAREEGFAVHHHKTRVMTAGVRQSLAGLTVNAQPNLARRDFEQLEATLFNCVRHGASTQNRAQHPDFRRHLEGRVAYAAMVNAQRALGLQSLLDQILW